MFDFAIKGGLIVDGTRQKAYRATVYLRDGVIAAISSDDRLPCAQAIDAEGLIVAPGFIDLHTHSDAAPYCGPNFESAVYQGVTFHVAGNCGSSLVPNNPKTRAHAFLGRTKQYYVNATDGEDSSACDMDSYKQEVQALTLPINFGTLIGHGTLRYQAMGNDRGEPAPEQLAHMQELLDRNMSQGAFGLSLGLTYLPGRYSKIEELIALARVVQAHDGIVAVHMRSESAKVFEAVEEMLRVARETGVKLHISHLKLMWKAQWGQTDRLLQMLDDGRAAGLVITADQYPYCASSTGAQSLLPAFAKEGSKEAFVARFDDPATYERIKQGVIESIELRGGPHTTTIANTRGQLPEADGKHLGELAEMWGVAPADAYCRVMRECAGGATAVYHAMDLPDVLQIMRRLDVAVGSDGYAHDYLTKPVLGKPHPRSVGTFPRFIQTVRENNLLSLEDMVYKMTGLPASILGLSNIGEIKPGLPGDLTVFDYQAVQDCATFQSPSVKPAGIQHVFVSGKPVLLDGAQTGERNGRFITK
ncbi:MAG: N-acyl-D-amino-acid deacylase family protein [Bacillota bacterium]|jgi:N-acyl-D-amino-acid deacylase